MQHGKGGWRRGSGCKLTYAVDDEQNFNGYLKSATWTSPFTTQCIMNHALTAIQPLNHSFQASRGWLTKFMKRNDLSLISKINFVNNFGSTKITVIQFSSICKTNKFILPWNILYILSLTKMRVSTMAAHNFHPYKLRKLETFLDCHQEYKWCILCMNRHRMCWLITFWLLDWYSLLSFEFISVIICFTISAIVDIYVQWIMTL